MLCCALVTGFISGYVVNTVFNEMFIPIIASVLNPLSCGICF